MNRDESRVHGVFADWLASADKTDPRLIAEMFPLVYDELRRVAGRQIGREYGPRTIGATALVHEAFIKLLPAANMAAADRDHFVAIAARAMRQILIDRARQRLAGKRGGEAVRVTMTDQVLDGLEKTGDAKRVDVLAVDEALSRLGEIDAEAANVVELRFFGGMTIEEVARARGMSPATVKRHWTFAQAWLRRELE